MFLHCGLTDAEDWHLLIISVAEARDLVQSLAVKEARVCWGVVVGEVTLGAQFGRTVGCASLTFCALVRLRE